MGDLSDFLSRLFDYGDFNPRNTCGAGWSGGLVWLHVVSDFLIWFSYMAIPCVLVYFVRKRRDLPFSSLFLLFGVFILACGLTHFVGMLMFSYPMYRLDGLIKLVTAGASVLTAFALIPVTPKLLAMRSPQELEAEIVERKKAEGKLQVLNEKLGELDVLKTQFFANVSHELRTPLALILGPTEKLLSSGNLGETGRRELEVVSRNARTLLKHVNDLLDVSKLDAGKMKAAYADVDLARLVRLAAGHFEVLAQEKKIDYTVEAPETLPAQADSDKLQRIVLNLLSNAFKFTPDGGRVRCALRAEGERFVLDVADSGPGVRPELREVAFERFRQLEGGATRRFGGTGLGLSIARDFVALHGGTIRIADAPEGGALLTVEAPLRAPAATEVLSAPPDSKESSLGARQTVEDLRSRPEASPASASPDKQKALVLVVEDNREMNRFIRDTLASSYRTEPAFDGQEGLQKALNLLPDLVVSDVMMPVLSGDQLLHRLRERRELDAVPVMLLTAKADDALRVDLLRRGAQDYLLKPFSAPELLARVGNLIAEAAVRREWVQAQVELARSHAEMEGFAHAASHDLQEPLRMIGSYLALIESRYRDTFDERGLGYLRHAVDAAQRMQAMIRSLLRYAEVGRAQLAPQPVDCAKVVRAAQDNLKQIIEESRSRVTVGPLPVVPGHEPLLIDLFQNLLDNAIKYRGSAPPEIHVAAERRDADWVFSVRDNGIGIDPQHFERIFLVFQRLHGRDHYPGSGVGLTIAKKIVEHHGGRIGVESVPGRGSTFWFSLPVAGRKPPNGPPLATPPAPAQTG